MRRGVGESYFGSWPDVQLHRWRGRAVNEVEVARVDEQASGLAEDEHRIARQMA
jgi:hypothetical protein